MKQIWKNFNAVRYSEIGHFLPISSLPESTKKQALPSNFTVLVWNIYKRLGEDLFDEDLKYLDARSHITCLQEVLAGDELDLPANMLLQNFHYGVSYKRADGKFEGVLSASRYSLHDYCMAIKSIGREPVTKTPKTALITYLTMENGQTLLVINVHMLLFKHLRLFNEELKKILINVKKDKHLPAIFCGDFNTFLPWQLALLDIILKREGFNRCKPAFRPRGARYLDHIYSRGLIMVESQIVDTISSSDHFPLLCEFKSE